MKHSLCVLRDKYWALIVTKMTEVVLDFDVQKRHQSRFRGQIFFGRIPTLISESRDVSATVGMKRSVQIQPKNLFSDRELNVSWPWADRELTMSWPWADRKLTMSWPWANMSCLLPYSYSEPRFRRRHYNIWEKVRTAPKTEAGFISETFLSDYQTGRCQAPSHYNTNTSLPTARVFRI